MGLLRPVCVVVGSVLTVTVYQQSKEFLELQNQTFPKPKQLWDKYWSEKAHHSESPARIQLGEIESQFVKNYYLIRHGQYNTKAEAAEEKKLTSLGWKQAQATGKHLRASEIHFPVIIHSGMIRAKQTMAAILWEYSDEFRSHICGVYKITDPGTLPKEQLTDFITSAKQSQDIPTEDIPNSEIATVFYPAKSPLQMSPFERFVPKDSLIFESALLNEGAPLAYPVPKRGRRPRDPDYIIDGSRIEAGFRFFFHRLPFHHWIPDSHYSYEQGPAVLHREENILFVGHANVIRYWICRALQIHPEAWLRFSLQHGSISKIAIWRNRLERDDCLVKIRAISDASHMKPTLLTTT